MHRLPRPSLLALAVELLSLFFPTSQALSSPTCNNIYGNPFWPDCTAALDKLPRDTTVRFFVEQQMRTAPPAANWIELVDGRGPYSQPIAQLPKWWSRGESNILHNLVLSFDLADRCTDGKAGTCNVFIMGYVNFDSSQVHIISSAVSSWYSLLDAGYRIVSGCLCTGQGGGWITQDGVQGFTIFQDTFGSSWLTGRFTYQIC